MNHWSRRTWWSSLTHMSFASIYRTRAQGWCHQTFPDLTCIKKALLKRYTALNRYFCLFEGGMSELKSHRIIIDSRGGVFCHGLHEFLKERLFKILLNAWTLTWAKMETPALSWWGLIKDMNCLKMVCRITRYASFSPIQSNGILYTNICFKTQDSR